MDEAEYSMIDSDNNLLIHGKGLECRCKRVIDFSLPIGIPSINLPVIRNGNYFGHVEKVIIIE